MQQLFTFISPVITDTTTSLEEKMESLIGKYIDMLLKDPGLPLFVLGEIQNNPEKFGKKPGGDGKPGGGRKPGGDGKPGGAEKPGAEKPCGRQEAWRREA